MNSDNPSIPSEINTPAIEEVAKLLPAYEIISLIARGGMGAVYHARQKSLDREVAIKILPPEYGMDEKFRSAFAQEAKSMAKFNHPNLIGVYDFGEANDILYLIMEMVNGNSLHDSAYGKIIDPTESARLISKICRGLAEAHKNDILHRDIKPANILLDASAEPKIGDFGLARAIGDHQSDTCYGTPGYTAPEVIHNPSAVDESTDIYSLGAMLYELLTGSLPDNPYVPASTKVQCSPDFDRIIRKAMHPSPSLRYRDANEMAADLIKLASTDNTNSRLITPATPNLQAAATSRAGSLSASKNTASAPIGTPTTSSGSGLAKNIFIILGLLVSIFVAWEGYKKLKANREAEQAEFDQQQEQIRAQRDEDIKNKKAAASAKTDDNEKVEDPKIETPLESLARLRNNLLQGSRREMPAGTIIKGNRARLLIEKPMTWHEAQSFAEEHGGHLAVFVSEEELNEYCGDKLSYGQTVWLGAGTAGNSNWSWIDGSEWNQDITKTSKAAYVSVEKTGVLAPKAASETFYSILEWKMSGDNPGSFKDQLARANTESGDHQYPPGTITYKDNHYLLILREIDWEEAGILAKSAGGTIAVPSSLEENYWMVNLLQSNLPSGASVWLGGHRSAQGTWQWLSGEPWTFGAWAKGAPDEPTRTQAACAGTSNGKWNDYPKNKKLDGLLIEWIHGNKPQTIVKNNNAVDSGVNEKRKKCIQLVNNLKKAFDERCANNIGAYEQKISRYNRSLTQQKKDALAPIIQKMQGFYIGHLIPANMPREDMPAALESILDEFIKKQEKLEKDFLSSVDSLRAKYCSSLLENAKEHKAKGLVTLERKVRTEISNSGKNAKDFIKHITGSPHTEAIQLAFQDADEIKPRSGKDRGWTATANSWQAKQLASRAIDGDPNTIWHSVWVPKDGVGFLPHILDVSFNTELEFSGILLTPRQHGINGMIEDYAVYIRNNGGVWRKIHEDTLPKGKQTNRVIFDEKVSATEIRIKIISSHFTELGSLAELDIIE